MIDIMDTCFVICLAFTILFFLISLVLFFVFDIKTIFSIRTGRAQAKTVKEMENANQNTGRLRVSGKTQTSKLSEKDKNKKRPPAVVTPINTKSKERNVIDNTGANETELLQGSNETELLSINSVGGTKTEANTPVQNNFTEELNLPEYDKGDSEKINFRIVKNIICVHTHEIIDF